ncbi:hypothetical protein [Dactylosporangium sp. CA-233914]|uniref:hypothetical protein n=1 Tax=Dactylosporangium sp. CA-233914 TaxID=3239934 RepID=UPI003D8CDA50
MELRRRRRSLGLALLVVFFGLVALVCAWGASGAGTWIYLVAGIVAILLGGTLVRDELRPFRFAIGPQGITTRDGLIEWAAIDRVVLDEPTPPATSGPHLLLQPGDRIVLKLADVKQSRDEIVSALQQHSAGRLDNRIARRGDDPGFLTVLRGYEAGRVDNLIRRAKDALLSGDPARRAEARAELEDPDLLVVLRGYDRAQVEAYLRKLRARLLVD